jgi:hypothetical protein
MFEISYQLYDLYNFFIQYFSNIIIWLLKNKLMKISH